MMSHSITMIRLFIIHIINPLILGGLGNMRKKIFLIICFYFISILCYRENFLAMQGDTDEIYYPWIEMECVREICTEDGFVKYLNTDDGGTKIEVLPATGHKYKIVISEDATMFGDGHLVEVCEKCEDIQCYYVPYEGILFTDICLLLVLILLILLIGFLAIFLWRRTRHS